MGWKIGAIGIWRPCLGPAHADLVADTKSNRGIPPFSLASQVENLYGCKNTLRPRIIDGGYSTVKSHFHGATVERAFHPVEPGVFRGRQAHSAPCS
ncbi:hypothetical protein BD310DRAFT_150263 [Dichomitus squalens]|uniref:Uncharacterized protein n=1 Tax=Dichomitus squalens TaxID=114155 RepID=A0A4Q9Q4P3_9APHY|nr:hypothetical protein BD310DRAFT_150263 [Dichomitus squalens]